MSEESKDEFKGYAEPIGTRIMLHSGYVRGRLAMHFFRSEMFRYFEQLTSGQTGWGISFNNWLEMHGWKIVDYKTYERIQGMEDDSLDESVLDRSALNKSALDTLDNWSAIVYDNQSAFLKEFTTGGWDLVSVTWHNEAMKFVYILKSGQHIADEVKIEEWLKFMEADK